MEQVVDPLLKRREYLNATEKMWKTGQSCLSTDLTAANQNFTQVPNLF